MHDALCCAFRKILYVLKCHLLWRNYRPRRLFRCERPVDAEFAANEPLYFRCVAQHIDADGQLVPAGIRVPDQSVNRGKYSKPADVLLPDPIQASAKWLYCGVVRCFPDDLPGQIEYEVKKKKVTNDFTVEHDPLEDNYSHTELRVYKDGVRLKKVTSTKVKKEYRTNLAFKAVLLIEPCG